MRRSTISTIKSEYYNENAFMKSLFSHSFGLFLVGFFLTFSWNCNFIHLFQTNLKECNLTRLSKFPYFAYKEWISNNRKYLLSIFCNLIR